MAALTRRRRAALYHAQKRRRESLRAIPKLHQTRLLGVDLAPVAFLGVFPAGSSSAPVTFGLEFELTGTPSGTLLNVGAGDPSLTLYYVSGVLTAVAGSGSTSSAAVTATATRSHVGSAGVPNLVRLTVSVRPGDGSLRIWDEDGLLAQGEASGGSIAAWSGEGGSDLVTTFDAAAGFNTLIADPGAPANVSESAPVRAFALYNPQHHLTDIPDFVPPVVFDEFLFRATFINGQVELFPLLDASED